MIKVREVMAGDVSPVAMFEIIPELYGRCKDNSVFCSIDLGIIGERVLYR